MEILKFGNSAPTAQKPARNKNNLKTLAGLASVAAIAVLGSTLAANISLGSASSLEFGQGVQVTAACDTAITLTPKVNFVNGANPVFMLSTIGFSDLDSRALGATLTNGGTGCATRTLTLNAYGDNSATPLNIATGSVSVATVGITTTAITSSAGFVVAGAQNLNSATTSFDLGITSPAATSGAVYKLTLQSN